jgi:hypothetical protein
MVNILFLFCGDAVHEFMGYGQKSLNLSAFLSIFHLPRVSRQSHDKEDEVESEAVQIFHGICFKPEENPGESQLLSS